MKYSVESMTKMLDKALKASIPDLPKIPNVLLAVGSVCRPGLNAELITSRVIEKFPSIGLPNGNDTAGNKNVMEMFTAVLVGEIVKAIVDEARVDVAFPPMGVSVVATGANAGGPIVATGGNMSFAGANGIVQ
jgi:hypothetical protein